MNTHAILYCLVKFLNYVVYEHVLIERVTEEVKRTLTIVNVNKVFIQFLMLVLSCFIEAARTSLLNRSSHMLIKIKVRMLTFFLFILCFH